MRTTQRVTFERSKIFYASPITDCWQAKRYTDAETILETVTESYKIPVGKLKSKSRKREIVQARMISMVLMKKKTKLGPSHTGRLFEGDKPGKTQDHTSV